MADETVNFFSTNLFVVLVFGSVIFTYCLMFYLCDAEFRNNFPNGSHDYADSQEDKVGDHWNQARDQFNQLALKLERLKVSCKSPWKVQYFPLYYIEYLTLQTPEIFVLGPIQSKSSKDVSNVV